MKFFLIMLFLSVFCFSCTNKYENLLKSNTAEVREFYMEGKTDDYDVNLICGMREKDYKINGYCTEPIEFGVLTFKLRNIDDFDVNIAQYVIFIGTSRFDGVLEKNPFDSTLVADLKRIINPHENVSVKLMIGEYVKESKLNLVSEDWLVDSEKVYEIIADNYKYELNIINANNIFEGEVYIKIINDSDEYKGDYYWYAMIVTRTGGKLSLIISPYTGEILASNSTFS